MPNPFLAVPLADYEGHMRSAAVQQFAPLSDLFAEALAFCRPASVAVLGIAGGNGLDRIDPDSIHRVVGVDINPAYLDAIRQRHPRVRGLELLCVDLATQLVRLDPVELVHAALIFEHAGTALCLDNAISLVAPGGHLSAVLQLPSESEPPVSPTAFPSIQNLQSHFSLISPAWLAGTLEQRGFRLTHQAQRPLASGKAFWMGIFGRGTPVHNE